jgi:transcriptional regulator with XRE-family HTH domain
MSPNKPRKPVDESTYEGRFAVRLRMLREKTGMNVHELAEKSGVPVSNILSWESCSRKPALCDALLNLAEALDVSIRTLIPKE